MNSFRKLFLSNNFLFDEISVFFLIKKFQSTTLCHDHGLLWSKNVSRFGIFTNEEFENFVDKYLTIDQTIFKMKICNCQIHQHKQTCRKKNNQFVNSNIQNHQ